MKLLYVEWVTILYFGIMFRGFVVVEGLPIAVLERNLCRTTTGWHVVVTTSHICDKNVNSAESSIVYATVDIYLVVLHEGE